MAEERLQIPIKVVPGARRDQLAGMLGDRLKIRVAAPPEGGRANQAVCALIARTLNIPQRNVEISAGHTSPEKTLAIRGIDRAEAYQRLGMV